MDSVVAVILAAGRGSRMHSDTIKVLHPLVGRPMIEHVIGSLRDAGIRRVILVVGYQADHVRRQVEEANFDQINVEFAVQKDQLGTGHAVMQAEDLLRGHRGHVIVTYGDTPLYRSETYGDLLRSHIDRGLHATVLSANFSDPAGYGRIVRDEHTNDFKEIVEQSEITSPRIEEITEINTGTYVFTTPRLFDLLHGIGNNNAQGEYFLPDTLKLLLGSGDKVGLHVLADAEEALGINDRTQLAHAEKVMRERVLTRMMESGVTIIDPESTHIDPQVSIKPDTVIRPFTVISGNTSIGAKCDIGPHAVVTDATVGHHVIIGPFVELGPDAHVAPYAKINRIHSGED